MSFQGIHLGEKSLISGETMLMVFEKIESGEILFWKNVFYGKSGIFREIRREERSIRAKQTK